MYYNQKHPYAKMAKNVTVDVSMVKSKSQMMHKQKWS